MSPNLPVRRVRRFLTSFLALTPSVLLFSLYPATAKEGDDAAVTIRITDTRFKCEEPILAREPGFDRCEIYTVPRFTAPPSALLQVFGHCEAMIKYKTRDGMIENRKILYERFNAAIVDGEGLAPVTMLFKPLVVVLDPIVDAKATDLRCIIDQVFDEDP